MRGGKENDTKAPRQCGISLSFSRVCKRDHVFSVTNNWLPFSLLSKKKRQRLRFAISCDVSFFAIFRVVRGEGNTAANGTTGVNGV